MAEPERGHRGFRLEIVFTSIEEFAAFCALISDGPIDATKQAQIDALVSKLNQSSASLEKALDQQKGT